MRARAFKEVKEAGSGGRPASIKSRNPFIKPKRKAGRKKLGLDMEKIGQEGSHRVRMEEVRDNLRWLREDLVWAEANDRYAAARKIRRQINQELEVELYLRSSWCPVCHRMFSGCQC